MTAIKATGALGLDHLVNVFSFCKPEKTSLRKAQTISLFCLYCGQEKEEFITSNDFLVAEEGINIGICSHCYTSFYSV